MYFGTQVHSTGFVSMTGEDCHFQNEKGIECNDNRWLDILGKSELLGILYTVHYIDAD
jgi:hypothetical protein